MNYYERHMGDYLKDTAHLSLLEHGIYGRLLDVYYTREAAIPSEQVARLIGARSKDERAALDVVLQEFFVLEAGNWHQARCDSEIAVYQKRVEHNQRVGKLGGRPRKSAANPKPANNPAGFENEPADNPPQSPVPRPQTPVIPSVPIGTGSTLPLTPDEIIFGYGLPMLTNAGTAEKQARSFLGGLRKAYGDALLIDTLRDCIKAKPLQPLEWLAKALPPEGVKPKLNAQEALEASNRAVAARFLEEEAARETV